LLVQVRTLECLIVPQDAMNDVALAHLCVFLSNLIRFFLHSVHRNHGRPRPNGFTGCAQNSPRSLLAENAHPVKR
jgi:hypothetical protein